MKLKVNLNMMKLILIVIFIKKGYKILGDLL